jgi:hypothetical protein
MAVTMNETTLGAALQPMDDRILLVSGATVVPGQVAYVDREAIDILARVFETNDKLYLVKRGVHGTAAVAHNAGAKIKTAPASYYGKYDKSGAANGTNELAVPWINVYSGNVFDINANAWRQVGFNGVAQGAPAWP